MICSFSNLEQAQLDTVQKLEKELGKTMLAFSCNDVKPADLKGDELSKLQTAEKENGLVLIAVEG